MMIMEANKKEEGKPRLRLTVEQLPELEKWQVGERYKVLIEIKQLSKHEMDEDEHEMCADFEITNIKVLPIKSNFTKDDVKVALDMEKLQYLR